MTFDQTDVDTAILSSEDSSLLTLLDDPDPVVFEAVSQKILTCPHLIPRLRRIQSESPATNAQVNADMILRTIQTDCFEVFIRQMKLAKSRSEDVDLEIAAANLSRFAFPEYNVSDLREWLDIVAIEVHKSFVKQAVPSDLTHLMSLNTVFFDQYRFSGASDNYYDPQNSYVHSVVKRRTGLPISLSVLYLLVAQRIGLDIVGVGMPLHFLVFSPELHVLIDVFNSGTFVSRSDCRAFVESTGMKFYDNMLEPISNFSIMERCMRNLVYAHKHAGQEWEHNLLLEGIERITGLGEKEL